VRLNDGWKTYWRSPGEVGIPPTIDWTGSENLASVEFLWPAPTRFRAFGIENFGYKHEVTFPLRIALEEPGAPARLKASVRLLACSDICVPETFALSLDVPTGAGVDAQAATRIADFAARVPDDGAESDLLVETAALTKDRSALIIAARSGMPFESPDIFPELGEGTAFGAPDIRLSEGSRALWARLPVLSMADAPPPLRVTLTDGARAATVSPALAEAPPQPPYAAQAGGASFGETAWIALIAALGGLILNAMPCVLPVLSIKLGSAMKTQARSRAAIRTGFLVSALGVLAFVWALAAATLGARALGLSVGWGLQFQNPAFLAAMILVLTLFAANLFGLFEIILPSGLQTRLARADGAPGHAGDFAAGAFAAVLATPCSAPFLGTAVAFALSGRPVDIAVVFTALGFGLATPYLAIAAAPGLVERLPKPGRWMLWLKAFLGLMLAATAGWLFFVLDGVAGGRVALVLGLLMAGLIGLLAAPRVGKVVRGAGVVALAATTLASPMLLAETAAPTVGPSAAVRATVWAPFDRAAIARAVSQGETIFVDVTADWCLTCKANKALVLDRDPVAAALSTPGVTPMQADWTRPDDAIARYLESFGRYGIPFNAVYGPDAPGGVVLPELLTVDAVMDALERASGRRKRMADG
jgi:suppressor for copper-sensitivity B